MKALFQLFLLRFKVTDDLCKIENKKYKQRKKEIIPIPTTKK